MIVPIDNPCGALILFLKMFDQGVTAPTVVNYLVENVTYGIATTDIEVLSEAIAGTNVIDATTVELGV